MTLTGIWPVKHWAKDEEGRTWCGLTADLEEIAERIQDVDCEKCLEARAQ